LVPKLLSLWLVQRVLKDLRRERVPIRDGISILEALGEAESKTENQVRLITYVRQALRRRDRRPAQIPSLDHSRDAGRVGAQRHDWDRHTGPWSGRLGRLQKLVQTVGQSPDQDAHLVVPATMNPTPSDRWGTRRCARGKRSPFCTGGQAIPEDIEPAEKQRLIDKLIGQQKDRAAIAASR